MVFLDQKTQYCHKDYTIQGNLQIKTSTCENTQGIFPQNQNNPKTCMEPKKTSNNQSNLEKAEHCCPCLQNIQQSYSCENSMALAQKEIQRSIEHTRTPTNKSTLICHLVYNKIGKNMQWRKTASSKMLFEKPKGYMQKNKSPQKCTLCNYVKNRKNVHNCCRSCFTADETFS